jgi:ABC-type transporter Mla maintaining outer membrane lipid asymmetry ATPase subunit MlaF
MGEIYIKGRKTSNLNDIERSRIIRNEIGFIFRRKNLIPNLNALENVMLPMISPDPGKAKKLLEKVGIRGINSFPAEMAFKMNRGLLWHEPWPMIHPLFWLMNLPENLIQIHPNL